jgi:hypothetical protein
MLERHAGTPKVVMNVFRDTFSMRILLDGPKQAKPTRTRKYITSQLPHFLTAFAKWCWKTDDVVHDDDSDDVLFLLRFAASCL